MNALKSEAESQSDSEQQKKLLAAAKLLADATARMVEAAKVHTTLHDMSVTVSGRVHTDTRTSPGSRVYGL